MNTLGDAQKQSKREVNLIMADTLLLIASNTMLAFERFLQVDKS